MTMSRVLVFLICTFIGLKAEGPKQSVPTGSAVYLEAANGFDIYLTKALETKKVPLKVVGSKDKAQFIIFATVTITSEESLARALGRVGTSRRHETDTVYDVAAKVTDVKTGDTVHIEQFRKDDALRGLRSTAEDLAKRLGKVVTSAK